MANQKFSPEFRQAMVQRLHDEGLTVPKLAKLTGVSESALYSWVGICQGICRLE